MKKLRILGIVLAAAGIVAICFASYINSQVAQGKIQVSQGEQKMSAGKQLFSVTPLTEKIGEGMTSGGDKKIAEGKQKITHYQGVANTLMTLGVISIIAGAGIFIWSFFVKRR